MLEINLQKILYTTKEILSIIKTSIVYLFQKYFLARKDVNYASLLYGKVGKLYKFHSKLVGSERHLIFYFIIKNYIEEINKEFIEILDLGCGDGMFEQLFLTKKNTIVTAIDISPNMLCAGMNKVDDIAYYNIINWVKDDFIRFLCKTTKKYDIILCIAINRFIYNEELFFSSLKKVLRENSVIFFKGIRKNLFNTLKIIIWSLLTFDLEGGLLELDYYIVKKLKHYGFKVRIIESSIFKDRLIEVTSC